MYNVDMQDICVWVMVICFLILAVYAVVMHFSRSWQQKRRTRILSDYDYGKYIKPNGSVNHDIHLTIKRIGGINRRNSR